MVKLLTPDEKFIICDHFQNFHRTDRTGNEDLFLTTFCATRMIDLPGK